MKKNDYNTVIEEIENPYLSWIRENEQFEYDREDVASAKEELLKNYTVFTSEDASIEERLYMYLRELPDSDFIYTDEDIYDPAMGDDSVNISPEGRCRPYFKPEWSPETIRSYYYPASLTIVKNSIVKEVRTRFPYKYGSNDFLRECALLSNDHLHIKEVLVHVKEEHSLEYEPGDEEKRGSLHITTVILSKDHPEMLERCVSGLNRAARAENIDLRTIVIDNGSSRENAEFYEALSDLHDFEYHFHPMNFEYSSLCNFGASLDGDDDILLFLNDDIEIPEETVFLRKMAEMARKDSIGAVGCKLLYPDGKSIQHNGISMLKSGPSHRLCTYPDDKEYCRGVNSHTRNVLAVTGAALMCEAEKFRKVKGFDESLKIAYTDVDLCFAFIREGYRNVCISDFYLIHHESISRNKDIEDVSAYLRLKNERDIFEKKYKDILDAVNPYESQYWSEISLDFIPRTKRDEKAGIAIERLELLDKRKYKLKKAGKRFFSSLDSVKFKLNDAFGNEDFIEIEGWAFIGGHPGYEYDVKLILDADGEKYICDTERTMRKDIEMVFADEKETLLSGFIARIRTDAVPKKDIKLSLALMRPAFFGKDVYKGEERDCEKNISWDKTAERFVVK